MWQPFWTRTSATLSGDTIHVYVNAIQGDQTTEQIAQDTDVAAYVNYVQAGNLIPGWELVHPDDSTTNTLRFESKTVG